MTTQTQITQTQNKLIARLKKGCDWYKYEGVVYRKGGRLGFIEPEELYEFKEKYIDGTYKYGDFMLVKEGREVKVYGSVDEEVAKITIEHECGYKPQIKVDFQSSS